MKSHVKAVVIGGGVVGCSVLYHLARAGWTDIMLIERSELTSGSSWHAAGGFHTLNGDPNVAKLQAYTVRLYQELEEVSGQSCSLHLTGGVMLADTPERMDFLRLAHAKGRYLGMDTELITPSLRLGFVREKGGIIETRLGNGAFKWLNAQLDGCPIYLGLTPKVSFRPCLGVEFGQVTGVGGQILASRTEPRTWLATRLLGRIAFSPIDALMFELQGGVVFPLTRDEFIFGRATTIYKAPFIVPFGGFELGVRF